MSRTSLRSKLASGNYRPDRMIRGRGIRPLQRLPAVPGDLSKEAKAAWKDVGRRAVALGTLTEYDVPLLALLARTLGSVAELEATLRKDGLIVSSGNVRKAHPGLQAIDRARALAHRLLGELGLTPGSRERISIDPDHIKDCGGNPFDEFVTPERSAKTVSIANLLAQRSAKESK